MQKCFKCIEKDGKQSGKETSFIGGKPKLPNNIEIPSCKLCDEKLVFFFQVHFASGEYEGMTMALFFCTNCYDEDYLIPEMVQVPLKDAVISKEFLDEYQRNFRILVFPTIQAELKRNYKDKIKFKRIEYEEVEKNLLHQKIGGNPNWIQGDETPKNYNSEDEFVFLMQWLEDYKFEKLPSAKGQNVYDLYTGGTKESNDSFYELFLANRLYFFGTNNKENPKVYIITQID